MRTQRGSALKAFAIRVGLHPLLWTKWREGREALWRPDVLIFWRRITIAPGPTPPPGVSKETRCGATCLRYFGQEIMWLILAAGQARTPSGWSDSPSACVVSTP